MGATAETVSALHRKGIQLWFHCGALHYRDPKSALSVEEIENLPNKRSVIVSELIRINEDSDNSGSLMLTPHFLPTTFQQRFALEYLGSCFMHAFSVRLIGQLDINLLTRSLDILVRQHDAMRTKIVVRDIVLRQEVGDIAACPLAVADLASEEEDAVTDDDVQCAAESFIDRWLEVGGTAFEAKLFKVTDTHHVLVVVWDHFFEDYTSVIIVFRDLWRLYRDFVKTEHISASNAPVQNSEYAAWQSHHQGAWLKLNGSFWEDRLRTAVALKLPIDSGLNRTVRYRRLELSSFETLGATLNAFASRTRMSVSLILFSFFAIAMFWWSGKREFVIPFSFHGRCSREHIETVGYLSNFLLLRVRIEDESTLGSVLTSVSREFFSAATHSDIGATVGRDPEFFSETVFLYYPTSPQNLLVPPLEEWDSEKQGLAITPFELKWRSPAILQEPPKFFPPFIFVSWGVPEGVRTEVQYRTDIFSRYAVRRFSHWLTLLAEHATSDASSLVAPLSGLRAST